MVPGAGWQRVVSTGVAGGGRRSALPGSAERFLADLGCSTGEELRLLFALRPDAFVTGAQNLRQVVTVLVEPASVAAYYEMADLGARQVMEVLAVRGPELTVAELAAALGSQEADVEEVVSRLADAWILRRSGRQLRANPGLVSALSHPCRLGRPAAELLAGTASSELGSIAVRLGCPGGGTKAALLERISGVLADRDRLSAMLRRAPAGTDRLLRSACEWPELRLSGPAAVMARRDDSPVGWCLRRGLLAPTGYLGVVLVREAGLALRAGKLVEGFAPRAPAPTLRPVDRQALDARLAQTALALVSDLVAVCEEWSAAPAKLLRSGGLGVREVRRVAKLTGRSETEAARLVQLAWVADLVGTDTEEAAPTPAYDEWKAADHARRWADLAEAWLRWPDHLSFAGLSVGGEKPTPPLLDEPPEPSALAQRFTLLQLISSLPPDQGVDVESALAAARWVRPGEWAAEDAEHLAVAASWILAEAEMLGLAAGGAMSSAGCALVQGQRSDAEAAIGKHLPAVVDQVILQADLTATVAGQPSAALAEELGLLADLESSGAASVWRFSEPSLRRGFEAGRDAAAIKSFLQAHSSVGVPQPLAYLVDDVGRRYGRLRVGAASSYLRCDDPSLLAEITRSKKAARLGLRLLAPTVAVSHRPPPEMLDTLRAGGWLAAAEHPDGTLVVAAPGGRRLPAGGDGSGPDDPDLDGFDLDDLLDDAELLGALSGVSPALAAVLASKSVRDLPGTADDIDELIARLRHAPDTPPPPPPPPSRPAAALPAAPSLRLFEASARPPEIVKDPRHIPELLAEAFRQGWVVRMSYVNASGMESEFYAEILHCRRGDLKVRYLGDRSGGAELPMYRVQWARVATEAEEERLYG